MSTVWAAHPHAVKQQSTSNDLNLKRRETWLTPMGQRILRESKLITSAGKHLLNQVLFRMGPKGEPGACFAGHAQLAESVGLNKKTSQRSMDRLRQLGVLTWSKGGRSPDGRTRRSNHYYLLDPEQSDLWRGKRRGSRDTMSPGHHDKLSHPTRSKCPPKVQSEGSKIERQTHTPPAAAGSGPNVIPFPGKQHTIGGGTERGRGGGAGVSARLEGGGRSDRAQRQQDALPDTGACTATVSPASAEAIGVLDHFETRRITERPDLSPVPKTQEQLDLIAHCIADYGSTELLLAVINHQMNDVEGVAERRHLDTEPCPRQWLGCRPGLLSDYKKQRGVSKGRRHKNGPAGTQSAPKDTNDGQPGPKSPRRDQTTIPRQARDLERCWLRLLSVHYNNLPQVPWANDPKAAQSGDELAHCCGGHDNAIKLLEYVVPRWDELTAHFRRPPAAPVLKIIIQFADGWFAEAINGKRNRIEARGDAQDGLRAAKREMLDRDEYRDDTSHPSVGWRTAD
jgi:hypothetical protein